MSTLAEINGILAGIQNDLKAIDLTKEKDISKIQQMSKPTTEIDSVVTREDFEEPHLDFTIEMFREANEKVNEYDKKADIQASMAEAKKDPSKYTEIGQRVGARQAVKEAVQGKYQELSRKKAVIEKYKQKYDAKVLVERQSDKIKANEAKIAENKVKLQQIKEFNNSVSGELGVINSNMALLKELEKLEKAVKAVEARENNLNQYKAANGDVDFIKALEEELANDKKALKTKSDEIMKQHKGVTLDPNNLSATIKTAQVNAQGQIDKAKKGIGDKAKNSNAEYIKTEIYNRLTSAKTDKDFADVLENARQDLDGENLELSEKNKEITNTIDTMNRGEQVRAAGTTTVTVAEPTEADIKARMDADPEVQQLQALIPVDDKVKKQMVYEALVEDKRFKSKFFHPIAALKVSFSKKTMEEWENRTYKDEIAKKKTEITEAIKAERKAKADEITAENTRAEGVSKTIESSFKRALFVDVMKADSATLEQMDKKVSGKVLSSAYDKAETEMDEEEK